MGAPIQTAKNGRTKQGRFAKGNSGGPGRPRRPDLYTIIEERALYEDVDLAAELWEVCQSLIAQAKKGNVQAARLLFGHLCGDPVSEDEVRLRFDADAPMSDIERAERIQSIFATAARRLESEGRTEEAARMRAAAGSPSLLD